MENSTAKYGLVGTIIATLIAGGIALYIHFDTKSEKQKIIEIEKKANKQKDTANLTISNVFMPEINTKIESAFFVKISNKSLQDAKKLNFKINFGEAEVLKCESQPENIFSPKYQYDSSIISFDIKEIKRNDSFYVYCLTSHPIFDSILITGSNLFKNEEYSFEQYKLKEDDTTSGVVTFFKVVGGAVFIAFAIFFVIATYTLLGRKLKL